MTMIGLLLLLRPFRCRAVGMSISSTTNAGDMMSILLRLVRFAMIIGIVMADNKIVTNTTKVSSLLLKDVGIGDDGGGPPVVNLHAPPMGWMSWERFRCNTNCEKYPNECINENLYQEMADALIDKGLHQIGYNRVHIDDCWTSGRDPQTHELIADPERFPSGIGALADYVHSKGIGLGIYSDAGSKTCAGYEGSLGYEDIDTKTFANWNIDYIKLDGCNLHLEEMEDAYTKFGNALKKVNRPMIYSCSWPAYITGKNGGNESDVPFDILYNKAGCNTWRNWHDIDNKWSIIQKIILHWADNWEVLSKIPTRSYNDADMLIAGDDRREEILSVDIAKLQFGFWSLISSPLLIGCDVRKIKDEFVEILSNSYVLGISQDELHSPAICTVGCRTTIGGKSGSSSSSTTTTTTGSSSNSSNPSSLIQVWMKQLFGDTIHTTAFGFFNLGNMTEENIMYSYEFTEPNQQFLYCSDLWSNNPTQNICLDGNDDWKFDIVSDNDGYPTRLNITAFNVQPTSHRMIRIYTKAGGSSSSSSKATAGGPKANMKIKSRNLESSSGLRTNQQQQHRYNNNDEEWNAFHDEVMKLAIPAALRSKEQQELAVSTN